MLRADDSRDRNCLMSCPLLHLSRSWSSMSRLVISVLCSLVCMVSTSLADRAFHSDATACVLSPHPDTSRSQFVATLRSARNKVRRWIRLFHAYSWLIRLKEGQSVGSYRHFAEDTLPILKFDRHRQVCFIHGIAPCTCRKQRGEASCMEAIGIIRSKGCEFSDTHI